MGRHIIPAATLFVLGVTLPHSSWAETIVVGDRRFTAQQLETIRTFDAQSGTPDVLASSPNLYVDPLALTIDPAGDVIVLDAGGAAVINPPALLRFDGQDGNRSTITSGPGLWFTPVDLDTDSAGDIIVLDAGGVAANRPPRLLRFDGQTGMRSEIVSGPGLWIDPVAMAVDPSGDVLVLDAGGAANAGH